MRAALGAVLLLVSACTGAAPGQGDGTPITRPRPPGAVDAAGGLGDRAYPSLGNAGYDVVSYDIDLRFGPDLDSMDGVVTVVGVASDPLSSFALDLVGYEVVSVEVAGDPAGFTREDRDLRVTPVAAIAAGSSFVVRVRYRGRPHPVDLHPHSRHPGWQRVSAVSGFLMSEPDGASGLFPSNDHPSDRADVVLRVTVPVGLEVVSGGDETELTTSGGVEHRFVMEDVAPYLVPLAIGTFRPVDSGEGIVTWLGGDVELPTAFRRQGEILRALEVDLGPYPFDTLGAVIVDSDLPAALETQTFPTYTAASARWGEPVIAHELSHQWFGDSIGVGQWDDVWLNEGFATFFAWRWVERDRGRAAYDRQVADAWNRMDRRAAAAPADPPADDLFDPTVYDRGALTLAALRRAVGDERFFSFVGSYVDRFTHRTVTTESFLAFVGSTLGGDAERLVRRWALEPTMPTLPGG